MFKTDWSLVIPDPMRHPRILFLSGNAPPVIDGVGDYADRLLEELRRQRPRWRWIWLSRRPRWFSSPCSRRKGTLLLQPRRSWNHLSLLHEVVDSLRPDILHVQDELYSFHETTAALDIASAARAKVVTTLHEFHDEHPKIAITSDLVKASNFVIANDSRTSERCLTATGRAVDRILWSGATILPPAGGHRPKVRSGLVVTFGFLSGLKSLETLHESLKVVRISRPDLIWRIIGPFEPETNQEHAALAERFEPDSGWIELTGAVTDLERLRRLLAEAQAMLLPFADGASTRRGTLQVAWAFGLPTVTTPPREPTDAIVDGENVLLVGEHEGWNEAVSRILSDQALADRLRAGGLESAERFSWQRLASEHLLIYEAILDNPSATS